MACLPPPDVSPLERQPGSCRQPVLCEPWQQPPHSLHSVRCSSGRATWCGLSCEVHAVWAMRSGCSRCPWTAILTHPLLCGLGYGRSSGPGGSRHCGTGRPMHGTLAERGLCSPPDELRPVVGVGHLRCAASQHTQAARLGGVSGARRRCGCLAAGSRALCASVRCSRGAHQPNPCCRSTSFDARRGTAAEL